MTGRSKKGAKQFSKIQEDIETRNRRVGGSGPKEQYVDNQRGIASMARGKDMKSKLEIFPNENNRKTNPRECAFIS